MTPDQSPSLVLVGQLRHQGSIGFADLFAFEVWLSDGQLAAGQTLRLTVMAGDRDLASFVAQHQAPATVRGTFSSVGADGSPPDDMTTGVLDPTGQRWRLVDLRETSADEAAP